MIPLFFRLSNMQSRAHLREKHLTAGQFSPAFPTEALTQMNIFSRKLQVLRLQISLVVRPPAWTLMTGLHCCLWFFYSLSQNTTVLRLMQRFVEQRRGSLCPLVAGRDVDAFWRIGRGAAEVTFADARAGRQSSPIGSPLNNYEAVLIPDHNEATGVHHRSSPDVNGGDNRLICRKINKYGWKLRLPAYKEEGDTLPCKAFKWKIITILKESVCVVYLLFRQHFS